MRLESIQDYVLSIIAGAVACGILLSLFPKGRSEGVIKLLCGLFLTTSVLHTLTNVNFGSLLSSWPLAEYTQGKALAAMGEDSAHDLLASRIKQETEEYILDKAAAMDAALTADVTLSDGDIPVPVAVSLSGRISAGARIRLQQLIQENLGISKENQLWTETNSAKP